MTEANGTWIAKVVLGSDIGKLISVAADDQNHMGILESLSVSKKHVTYRLRGGFVFSRPKDSNVDTYVIETPQKGVKND